MFERERHRLVAVRDRRRLGAGRDQPGRSVDHRPDRRRLDLRRGRPDLRPPPRRHGPRRRGFDPGRGAAHGRAEADVGGAGGEARDHPDLDRAAIAADVRLRPHARRPRRGDRERRGQERQGGRGDHRRGRGRPRHLRHPPGLDGRREGDRRQADLPLLPARRLLCRRDGACSRAAAAPPPSAPRSSRR